MSWSRCYTSINIESRNVYVPESAEANVDRAGSAMFGKQVAFNDNQLSIEELSNPIDFNDFSVNQEISRRGAQLLRLTVEAFPIP
jgi:hypothetical protein